jgi:hypothetical protein
VRCVGERHTAAAAVVRVVRAWSGVGQGMVRGWSGQLLVSGMPRKPHHEAVFTTFQFPLVRVVRASVNFLYISLVSSFLYYCLSSFSSNFTLALTTLTTFQ